MTARVVAALRILRAVAERPDPTVSIGVGGIAATLGLQLSSVSRLCTDLQACGVLARGEVYGSYRLGPVATALSGRAAAPFARAVRYALTSAAQLSGETALLATRTATAVRVVASVGSAWTLHSPAHLAEEVVDERSAVAQAGSEEVLPGPRPRFMESTVGECVEVAVPVRGPTGERVAVVAIRLPVNRARQGTPRARRAVDAARRVLERALAEPVCPEHVAAALPPLHHPAPAVDAALRILDHLAVQPGTPADVAIATGLRVERVQRLLDSCVHDGAVVVESGRHRLSWSVHGWYRAATAPTLIQVGGELVARTAAATGVCGFITVLQGMRSFTVVEELEQVGPGVVMMPWLGRPHPVIGSDGGPTLVMDFTAEEVHQLLGHRHTAEEMQTLTARVRRVVRAGVVSVEAVEEGGLVSVSAPVRDAAGSVAAALCLVGATRLTRSRVAELELVTRDAAGTLSRLLGAGP